MSLSIRRFGDVEIAVINAGAMEWMPQFRADEDWRPGAQLTSDGHGILDILGLVVRTPRSVVVLDPNSFNEDDAMPAFDLRPGLGLRSALAELSVEPQDVTHVVITHGHFDHLSGVLSPRDSLQLRFPNAEHIFPADDVPHGTRAGVRADQIGHALQALKGSGQLHLVRGDSELGDGVTSLLHAPGESEGHQVVRFDCRDRLIYYLGDLIHFPVEVEHLEWAPLEDRDRDALRRSRERVFADPGERDATFIFSHAAFPDWGRVTAAPDGGWRWAFDSVA